MKLSRISFFWLNTQKKKTFFFQKFLFIASKSKTEEMITENFELYSWMYILSAFYLLINHFENFDVVLWKIARCKLFPSRKRIIFGFFNLSENVWQCFYLLWKFYYSVGRALSVFKCWPLFFWEKNSWFWSIILQFENGKYLRPASKRNTFAKWLWKCSGYEIFGKLTIH